MDLYHISLFIHIVTLVVAGGATAVTKLAASRREKARTVSEALEWHSILIAGARVFPICIAAFVVTGMIMLSRTTVQPWHSGFVIAGVVGSVLLLAAGAYLGVKGNGLKQALTQMAKQGGDRPVPRLIPPPLVTVLPTVNTGIALAVAFDMTVKPNVPVSLGVLAVGALIGLAIAAPSPARQPSKVRESAADV